MTVISDSSSESKPLQRHAARSGYLFLCDRSAGPHARLVVDRLRLGRSALLNIGTELGHGGLSSLLAGPTPQPRQRGAAQCSSIPSRAQQCEMLM